MYFVIDIEFETMHSFSFLYVCLYPYMRISLKLYVVNWLFVFLFCFVNCRKKGFPLVPFVNLFILIGNYI